MGELTYNSERITTSGVLFEAGRYFIARRKEGGEIGGLWEFPGGKHKWGETPEESLAREYLEELHLKVYVGTCFLQHEFIHKSVLYHAHVFWVDAVAPAQYRLHEHQDARWVTLEELLQLPLVPSDIPTRNRIETLSLG